VHCPNPNPNRYGYPDSDGLGYTNSNCHCYANRDCNGNSDSYTNSYSTAYTFAKRYGFAKASANSAAAPVVWRRALVERVVLNALGDITAASAPTAFICHRLSPRRISDRRSRSTSVECGAAGFFTIFFTFGVKA
jgi:hypothetical protein